MHTNVKKPLWKTAPPATFPNNAEMVTTVTAGTNTDELSSADEDWVLQKTLERKRSNSVGSTSHKKKDSVSFPIIY